MINHPHVFPNLTNAVTLATRDSSNHRGNDDHPSNDRPDSSHEYLQWRGDQKRSLRVQGMHVDVRAWMR